MTREEKNNKCKELLSFLAQKSDVCEEVSGLTLWKLKNDLEKAKQYKSGYYRNKKGEFIHVKGIEVTNDTSNLCRMGFNGEDRGVWIHYCYIDKNSISYHDMPICSFCYFLNEGCVSEEVFKPTTKKCFENKLRETIIKCLSDYKEKRNLEEYIEIVEKEIELFDTMCKLSTDE